MKLLLMLIVIVVYPILAALTISLSVILSYQESTPLIIAGLWVAGMVGTLGLINCKCKSS